MVEWDKQKKILIVIAVLFFLGIVGYFIYVGGTRGVANLMDTMMWITIWMMVIGLIVGVVYFLFFYEKKINASLEVFKQIKQEARVNRLKNIKNLYLSGDKEYSRPILLGKIRGFSSRKNYFKELNEKNEVFQMETIFLVRQKGTGMLSALINFFAGNLVVRCPRSLHSNLHGDITINATNLVKHLYYFYPNTEHLNIESIDETLYNEGERYVQLNFISKIEPIISRAVGVTKEDLKTLEGKSGYELVTDKGEKALGK